MAGPPRARKTHELYKRRFCGWKVAGAPLLRMEGFSGRYCGNYPWVRNWCAPTQLHWLCIGFGAQLVRAHGCVIICPTGATFSIFSISSASPNDFLHFPLPSDPHASSSRKSSARDFLHFHHASVAPAIDTVSRKLP